jgi:hypothetical protein
MYEKNVPLLQGKNKLKNIKKQCPLLTVIFANDIISKLHIATNCKNLNEQQFKNFYLKYKNNSDGNSIWYYAINKVKNWQKDGGCVIVPKCCNSNCEKYGCQKHLKNNLMNKPKSFKSYHFCGYTNENNCVRLISGRQMVIESWMKTSSIKSLNLTVDQEPLFREILNKTYE